jgi:hypothetical protein
VIRDACGRALYGGFGTRRQTQGSTVATPVTADWAAGSCRTGLDCGKEGTMGGGEEGTYRETWVYHVITLCEAIRKKVSYRGFFLEAKDWEAGL